MGRMTMANYAAFGGDWHVIDYEHAESLRPCNCCGTGIAQRYTITKEGAGIRVVGSECVKQVVRPSDHLLVKGLESVIGSAQREWERPYRIQQLREAAAGWETHVAADDVHPDYLRTLRWRLYNDCNPETLLKDMRSAALGWEFAWRKWTTDEIRVRRLYIQQAVDMKFTCLRRSM